MGIRSDVGIAVKAEFVEGFEKVANELGWNFQVSGQVTIFEDELGKGYLFESVKWYSEYPDVKAFTDYLESIGDENYLIVEACQEYPNSTEGDAGGWEDNPFNICREVSVSISMGN